MRHSYNLANSLLHNLLILVLLLSLFAQNIHATENSPSQSDVIIPVIEPADLNNDPSFLKKLRVELNAAAEKQAKQSEKDGVFKTVNKNFAPDSLAFAIAGGLVYFERLKLTTGADPLLMVKHVESLKDPIAHISFYTFMLANGYYIDFRTKGMDPMTKALAMRGLTYQGLAVGSFASTVTADLLGTFKACADGWIANKYDEESQAACDYAWSQWTTRNKATQYIPQILSLLVSQKVTELFEAGASKALKNQYTISALKKVDSKAVKLFKITSANIDLIITPGGVVVKGLRFAGKTVRFTAFLYIDHLITPTVTRIGNNLLQPLFFDFDAVAINKALYSASKYNWSPQAAKQDTSDCAFGRKCNSYEKLAEELKNFTERMANWRLHLNGKNESDLSGWLDNTKSLIHQIDYTRNYYHKYMENLFTTLERQKLINAGEFNDAPDRAWALQRKYPFRTLPLFGTKTDHVFENQNVNDLYLNKPYELEKYQSQTIYNETVKFISKINNEKWPNELRNKIISLVKPLLTSDIYQQGKALYNINKYAGIYWEKTDTRMVLMDQIILRDFMKSLGNPKPQLHEGSAYALAFDTHTANYKTAKTAKFDLSRMPYNFVRTSDVATYHMICGEKSATINQSTFGGIEFFSPRVVSYKEKPEICNKWLNNLNSNTLYNREVTVDGVTYSNITRYLSAKIDRNILGDINDENTKNVQFQKWWLQNTANNIKIAFKNLDTQYSVITEKAFDQVLDRKSYLDFTVDMYTNQSLYLSSNIEDNFYFELSTYFKILRSLMLDEKINNRTALVDLAKSVNQYKNLSSHFSEEQAKKKILTDFSYLLKVVNVSTSDITSLDDIATKMYFPLRSELEKSPNAYDKQIRLGVFSLKKHLTHYRIIALEEKYRELLTLLRTSALDMQKIETLRSELAEANSHVFASVKQIIQSVPEDSLDANTKVVGSIANGLDNLEADARRFIMMRIQLTNRLDVDISKLNEYLGEQTRKAPKQGSTPHSQ